MAEYDRLAQALCSVTVQAGDAAVPVVADILLGTLAAHRIRIPRIVLRIRQAPNTVVGVGIGVGAVRVGECRFGNVPVPARGSAGFLGGSIAQGLTEQRVTPEDRVDFRRQTMPLSLADVLSTKVQN